MITCSRCGSFRYPNEMAVVATIDSQPARLCSRCERQLLAQLQNKRAVGMLIRSTLPLGEIVRIRMEKASRYAGGKFEEERI